MLRALLSIHRAATLFVVVLALYLSVTGTLLLSVDLRSILTHAPKNDPNVVPLWEDASGPPNFRVMTAADCIAAPLPAASDFGPMLDRVLQSAHAAVPNAIIRYAELRMVGGRPVGQFGIPGRVLRFDALTGQQLPMPPPRPASPMPIRTKLKYVHRMTFSTAEQVMGAPGLILTTSAAVGLIVLLVTGILIFLPMWKARARKGRSSPFWKSGGWWRTLHRVVSVIMAVFLTNLILSGTFLAVDNLIHSTHLMLITHNDAIPLEKVAGANIDVSSPLRDAELPDMLRTTLAAGKSAAPAEPVKVIRLRYFAGKPQGVLVLGIGDHTHQLVFNAVSGKLASISEPGNPATGWPFGWQAHQIAKSIHRGDFYGLTGSMMSLCAGVSLFYLSLSGIILYWRKWKQRRRTGNSKLLWV